MEVSVFRATFCIEFLNIKMLFFVSSNLVAGRVKFFRRSRSSLTRKSFVSVTSNSVLPEQADGAIDCWGQGKGFTATEIVSVKFNCRSWSTVEHGHSSTRSSLLCLSRSHPISNT